MENIPNVLLNARRDLPCIEGYELLNDWQWDTVSKTFFLNFSMSLTRASTNVPSYTEWFVTVPKNYPFGEVKIYPSVRNSITATFQHQACNSSISKNGLWRSGALCVTTISSNLSRSAFEKAPLDGGNRLSWMIKRTKNWLYAAIDGTLTSNDELFESPDFKIQDADGLTYSAIYNEDIVSAINWSDESETNYHSGTVDYHLMICSDSCYLIPKEYVSFNGEFIFHPTWGAFCPDLSNTRTIKGMWILLNHVPIVNIWQAPMTWQQLCDCCSCDGLDLINEVQKFAHYCRDGRRHPISVGFPIPEKFGGPDREITWQTFLLPALASKSSAPNGFRNSEKGCFSADKAYRLTNNMPLSWITTENWNEHSISSRGHMPEKIESLDILLIGCGSLGSTIAEILSRANVHHITCLDKERFTAGNLCRHVLTLSSLGQSKAAALSTHLCEVNAHITPAHISASFELGEDGKPTVDLSSYNLIIDTTGEDSVLQVLNACEFERAKTLISASVGLGAKRLYFSAIKTKRPNFNDFLETVRPYCEKDTVDQDLSKLPREGLGCWHPLFPARSEDIWLAAGTVTKLIEHFFVAQNLSSLTTIYEQRTSNGLFEGYQTVEVKSS